MSGIMSHRPVVFHRAHSCRPLYLGACRPPKNPHYVLPLEGRGGGGGGGGGAAPPPPPRIIRVARDIRCYMMAVVSCSTTVEPGCVLLLINYSLSGSACAAVLGCACDEIIHATFRVEKTVWPFVSTNKVIRQR
jgi:hypothetical protein